MLTATVDRWVLIFSGVWVILWGFGVKNAEAAYFKFDYPPNPETFVFELTDPVKVDQARQMLSGQIPKRHIGGTVVKLPIDYNLPWSYSLDPASIYFFDYSVEVCDASIQYVENNLNLVCGSILPNCNWCPWNSRLLSEIQAVTPTPTSTTKPGDANGDNVVDGKDYIIWLNHYNQIVIGGQSVGDFDKNGRVDGLDYVIWLNNYGL